MRFEEYLVSSWMVRIQTQISGKTIHQSIDLTYSYLEAARNQ